MDLERLLDDHRAIGLHIGKPRFTTQGGHNKDRNTIILKLLLNEMESFNAIHLGHHNIGHHQIGLEFPELLDTFLAIAREDDLIASLAQRDFENRLHGQIIVHNENCAFLLHAADSPHIVMTAASIRGYYTRTWAASSQGQLGLQIAG